MPGADCGTDHELLVATIQVKLKKTKKPETENKYNLCDIPERYAVEVKNRFAALDLIYRTRRAVERGGGYCEGRRQKQHNKISKAKEE